MISVESERITDLSRLVDEYNDIANQANATRFETLATRTLGDTNAGTLISSDGWEAATAGLARAEKLGLDPAHVLTETWSQREFETAADVGAVMSWRIEGHLRTVVDEGILEPLPELGTDTGRYDWVIDRTAQNHSDVPEAWRDHLTERGTYIDDRMTQRGVELTIEKPSWTQQLGPVPADPQRRGAWMRLAAEIDLFRTRYNVPDDSPVAIPEDLRDHPVGANLVARVTALRKATGIRAARGNTRESTPAEQLAALQKIAQRVDAKRPIADAEKAAAALNPEHRSPLASLLERAARLAETSTRNLDAANNKTGPTEEVDDGTTPRISDLPSPVERPRGPRL